MKETDKQWSSEKDKDRNKAERDKMAKERSKQQQADDMGGGRQQGGWEEGGEQGSMGRKPATERDRDYDPDGDRMGPSDDRMRR